MRFSIESVDFKPYPVAFQMFRQSPAQDIGKDLYKRGLKLQALARTSVGKQSGYLARSISVSYHMGVKNPYVVVGSNLNYAYYVHEGTKPHIIRPRNARSLRFVSHGRVIYASKVNHPGTKAQRYLSRHLRNVVR